MSAERKPGERWRFVFEGVIDPDGDLAVSHGRSLFYFAKERFPYAVSAERLPDPEPDWEPHDICDDADGERWRRSPFARRVWLSYPDVYRHKARPDADMARPLTPVMLGGKHVSEIEP